MSIVRTSAMRFKSQQIMLLSVLLGVALLLSSTIAKVEAQVAGTSVWTHVGAACVPDEDSVAKYEDSAARFGHAGANTGDIYARCNVVNPQDDGGNPNWNALEIVYFKQKNTSRVTAELVRVSNSTGGVFTIPGSTFDSDNYGSSNSAQTRLVIFHQNLDFSQYAYYVQIRASRGDADVGNNPAISIVRLLRVRE